MGYNTTVVFLNDAVHNIEDDKDFPRKLHLGILQCGARNPDRPIDVPVFGHVNAVQVVACAHADVQQVIAVGGNTGHILGNGGWANSEHRLLRAVAAMHGFRLVRDPNVVPSTKFHSLDCRDCAADAPYGTCFDCKAPLTSQYRCPNKGYDHRR